PGLSRNSLSFMVHPPPSPGGHLADHAAHRRRVVQIAGPPHLVQPETDQRLLLPGLTPRWGPGLRHPHLRHRRSPLVLLAACRGGTAPTPSCRAGSPPPAARRSAPAPRRLP